MSDDDFKKQVDRQISPATQEESGLPAGPVVLILVAAALVVAVAVWAWRYTMDIKMAAVLTVAAVASAWLVYSRLKKSIGRPAPKASLGRLILNILVSGAILLAIWYFYMGGMGDVVEY